MEKTRITGKTGRQLRLQGHQRTGGEPQAPWQFSERPTAVPVNEWKRYQQLACELEGAEAVVQNVRQRLQRIEEQWIRRIARRQARVDQSMEHLMAAVPVTDFVQ